MKRKLLTCFFLSFGVSSLCHGNTLKSNLPARCMECTDILFRTFAAPSEYSLSELLKLAYQYCTYLEALKQKKNDPLTKEEERQRIDQDMAVINSLLTPILSAYSVGDFMFANTTLGEMISQEIQNNSENTRTDE